MSVKIKIRGAQALQKKLTKTPDRAKQMVDHELRVGARSLAVGYCNATLPPNQSREGFERRIRREIKWVFPARVFGATGDETRVVLRLFAQFAPHLAPAYRAARAKRNVRKMNELINLAGIPQGEPTEQVLNEWRTGPKGRVNGRNRPAFLVKINTREVLIRQQIGKIGYAKAAWYHAAQYFGSRVRGGGGASGGTYQRVPDWVRKVANKYKGAGGVREKKSGSVFSYRIFSSVKHAQRAEDPAGYAIARDRVQKNLTLSMKKAWEAEKKKIFRL